MFRLCRIVGWSWREETVYETPGASSGKAFRGAGRRHAVSPTRKRGERGPFEKPPAAERLRKKSCSAAWVGTAFLLRGLPPTSKISSELRPSEALPLHGKCGIQR